MYVARRLWPAAVTIAVLVGASAAHSQQTRILPPDTELLFTVNLKQLLDSEAARANRGLIDLAKAKIAEQLAVKGVAQHLQRADFDLFRDLGRVTVAVPGGRSANDGFILLEGSFDSAKIAAALLEANKQAGAEATVKAITIGNVPAFEVVAKDQQRMYVGVLNKTTMIACSTKDDFRGAVDRLAASKPGAFASPSFKALIEAADKQQSIGIVATSKLLAKLAEKAPEGAGDQAKAALGFLDQVEGFHLGVTIQKNIDLVVGLNAKDAETANKFQGTVKLVLAVAKQKLDEQAKMNENLAPAAEIVNSLQVSTNGSNLAIRGQITDAQLEKLLKNLPNQ
jgi:hypothetical protein